MHFDFFSAGIGILVLVGIKLFDPKCGLTIDSEGITDNSNFTSIGLITWADIGNIRSSRVRSEKFIFIEVNNPFYYINRSNNRLGKKIMRANLRMYGTPISLSSRTLKYSFSDLESLIMKEFEKQLLNKNESRNSDLLETNVQKTIDNS